MVIYFLNKVPFFNISFFSSHFTAEMVLVVAIKKMSSTPLSLSRNALKLNLKTLHDLSYLSLSLFLSHSKYYGFTFKVVFNRNWKIMVVLRSTNLLLQVATYYIHSNLAGLFLQKIFDFIWWTNQARKTYLRRIANRHLQHFSNLKMYSFKTTKTLETLI
jgi:hypothetical protein